MFWLIRTSAKHADLALTDELTPTVCIEAAEAPLHSTAKTMQ